MKNRKFRQSRLLMPAVFFFAVGSALLLQSHASRSGTSGGGAMGVKTEIAVSPELKLVFNKSDVFTTLNQKVLPDIMPDVIPTLFGEVGGTVLTGDSLETTLGTYNLVKAEDEHFSTPTDQLIADIAGQAIDLLSLGILSEKKQKQIEEAITDKLKLGSLNVYLTYEVNVKDLKLALDTGGVDLDITPNGANTLKSALEIPGLKVTGTLDVYAKAKIYLDWSQIGLGWVAKVIGGSSTSTIQVKILDKSLPITLEKLSATVNTVLKFDESTKAPAVESLDEFSLAFGSFDIDDDDVKFIKQKILDAGLGAFQDDACEKNEDLTECVSREIASAAQKELSGLKDGINEAITEALAEVLSLEKGMSVGGVSVDAGITLAGFSLDNGSPYINTTWDSSFLLSFTKDACAQAVPAFTADSPLDIGTYASGAGEADVIAPMALPQAALHALVQSGALCRSLPYTDPATSVTFSGTLKPKGSPTFGRGTYDVVVMTWDNYDHVKDLLGNSCVYGDAEDAEDGTGGGGGGTGTVSYTISVPWISGGDSDGSALTFSTSAVGDVSGGISDDDGDAEYDLLISTEPETGLQMDLPVGLEATTTVAGKSVKLTMTGTLHVVGRLEPDDENQIYFNIKKVWVGGVSASTSSKSITVDTDELTEQFNETLEKTYYATKVRYVTYYRCLESFTSTCGVRTETEDVSCGEVCQVPAGIEVTSLGAYGYELRTDELIVGKDSLTLALTTEVEDTDTGCQDDGIDRDYDPLTNANLEDLIAMSELAAKIRQYMAEEGMNEASEIAEQMEQYTDGSYLDELWQIIIIDENPYPQDEELFQRIDLMVDDIRIYSDPEYIEMRESERVQLIDQITTDYQNSVQMQTVEPVKIVQ